MGGYNPSIHVMVGGGMLYIGYASAPCPIKSHLSQLGLSISLAYISGSPWPCSSYGLQLTSQHLLEGWVLLMNIFVQHLNYY